MPITAKGFKITFELKCEMGKLIDERTTLIQIRATASNELKQVVKLLTEIQLKTQAKC